MLIKEYEKILSMLQQMTPINPDDLDLSWCDDKNRETIMNVTKAEYYHWKNRVNQLNLILDKLKQHNDGDSDV